MNHFSTKRGITLLEILIVITIMIILLGITIYSFSAMRARKQLDVTVDSIASKLEEAKAYSLSGKDGTTFGVAFTGTTYIAFDGSTYNASDPDNVTWTLPSSLELSTNLSGSATHILFARLTGFPQATGTITINDTTRASTTAYITVGTLGDISVVK